MGTMNIMWLGCGALAVISMAVALWAYAKKEQQVEKSETEAFDFHVDFWNGRRYHGYFYDGTVIKNGFLLGVNKGELQVKDVVRVLVKDDDLLEGLWQAHPLKLSHLPTGKVIATGEKKNEQWKIIYPNEHGIALVGWINTKKELQKNQKYSAENTYDNHFKLL